MHKIAKYYYRIGKGGEADLYFQKILDLFEQRWKVLSKISKNFQTLDEKDDFVLDFEIFFEDNCEQIQLTFELMIDHLEYQKPQAMINDLINIKEYLMKEDQDINK